MAESEPALTVAICTRNRRDSLLRALASLARQETRAAWDVLVVENASEDDTGAARTVTSSRRVSSFSCMFTVTV